MRKDLKIITILLSVVIFHLAFTDGWGRIRIRIPNPVRVVRRVVRKVGQGIKTGVRKTGEGIKTGVRKTGEGLKKAGEGLKKAGEVTGKHLYKGLRETGKALITASSIVSDILDRINLMKFIWKKLGACCVFYPPLCRAKREYESIQRRLKYYNNEIDKAWKKVESVYQWIIKINENVEDIGYHVERLTSSLKDSVQPLLPPLIVQYNNKMNSIKQDVKWKNSSVIHLTRQGVTTFVQIEMAWKCPKVVSSIKDGLKDLRKARDKCVTIQRESNDLLRFFDQGWRQLKATLSSQKLRQQLEKIKALCLDLRQSSCVSTIDKYLRQISSANYGTAFGLQEEIINTLSAIKYTFSCLKRKRRVITTVSEHCQKGNENFHAVYQQAVQDFFPNKELCTGLEGTDYTTKDDVLKQLRVFAFEKGFYSSCELNNREIITKTCLDYSKLASTYNLPPQESSRLISDCKKIAPGIVGKIQCRPAICRNGGKCEERVNTYVCTCSKRFKGKHCEIDTETQCHPGLCQHGGKCHQEHKSYSCFCAQGFAGRHCEAKAEYPVCRYGNWWGSFDRAGWSVCPSTSPYVAGLERSRSNQGGNDYIYHLEAANCCQATAPFIDGQHDCVIADWVGSFDRSRTWNMCPRGYYLGGLERSGGQNLHNIERARCCKPRNQPLFYKDCYKENVWSKFDHHNRGMVSCGRNGYYITGLYRSNCDLLYCVEEFMCCSMLSAAKDVKVLKLRVRSEGCDDRKKTVGCGLAVIEIDGKDYSKHGRGYNFVVMDGWTGNIEHQVNFDTHANVGNVNNMIKFIRGITKSKIVLAAVQDEGQRSMTSDAYRALLAIGAKEPMKRDYRGSFALIGFSRNIKPGFVQQVDNLRAQGPSIVQKLITLPYTVCSDPKDLGMQNGKIKDSQISASSEWNRHHGANNARLYFRAHSGRTGAWSSRVNDVNQWLQVDFKTSSIVLAINIQGREDCCNQFVRTYTVSWSNDGKTFYPYKHQGQTKIFTGNNDRHNVVQQIISPPIIARYIRVNPKSWNQHISLRLEFIGC